MSISTPKKGRKEAQRMLAGCSSTLPCVKRQQKELKIKSRESPAKQNKENVGGKRRCRSNANSVRQLCLGIGSLGRERGLQGSVC